MPQLDPTSYASQIFWLVVTFAVLYVLMWKVALPRVSTLLRERQERIDDDLEKASRVKAEAEQVLRSYEEAIAAGRVRAQAALREAAERVAKEAADAQAAAAARLDRETEEAERRIEAAKREALAGVRQVAGEAARAAAAKLIGADVPPAEAEDAAGRAIGERQQ
jgi:F-type H+-transporting ATPase subunit b